MLLFRKAESAPILATFVLHFIVSEKTCSDGFFVDNVKIFATINNRIDNNQSNKLLASARAHKTIFSHVHVLVITCPLSFYLFFILIDPCTIPIFYCMIIFHAFMCHTLYFPWFFRTSVDINYIGTILSNEKCRAFETKSFCKCITIIKMIQFERAEPACKLSISVGCCFHCNGVLLVKLWACLSIIQTFTETLLVIGTYSLRSIVVVLSRMRGCHFLCFKTIGTYDYTATSRS